ncbi:TetR/AcrR family transcriptional regulator [Pseudonocardiaceae bacterium YIM PH 21723]|nr:TetR/AcrR family transcriptional regulator [Pseudonocardiaceae bacterium YIM PH 21723]
MAEAIARLTQAQRSERTRELLLDSTIDCLVELGYARTSTGEICRRAGVTRGAHQHHFATRAELFSQAVEHLVARLISDILPNAVLSGTLEERVEAGIDQLWRGYSGELSIAAMELWVAARTDPELRDTMRPVDKALVRSTIEGFRHLWGDLVDDDKFDRLFGLTLTVIRGLALDAMIGGDPERRERQLAEWKAMAKAIILT